MGIDADNICMVVLGLFVFHDSDEKHAHVKRQI